jgi:hypothetical protein
VARRRPGSAIRLRAGKAVGIGRCSFIPDVGADHSSLSAPRSLLKHHPPMTPDMDGVKIAPGDDPHGNREIAR